MMTKEEEKEVVKGILRQAEREFEDKEMWSKNINNLQLPNNEKGVELLKKYYEAGNDKFKLGVIDLSSSYMENRYAAEFLTKLLTKNKDNEGRKGLKRYIADISHSYLVGDMEWVEQFWMLRRTFAGF